jgi:hypothetical protein
VTERSDQEKNWEWAKQEQEPVEKALPGIDPKTPSIARVYNYMIGGKDNFAADREVAELSLKVAPEAPRSARENRDFLRRVVRYLIQEAGVRQFLDIGSGLPTQGNVHEIAHEIDPTIRVVYVDIDPIVLVHSRALLPRDGTTRVIQADVRRPAQILQNPDVRSFLDFDQPIGLLFIAILHHLNDDEDPAGVAATFRDALPSGSHIAISHFFDPGESRPESSKQAQASDKLFAERLGTGRFRTEAEIRPFFAGLDLIDPGLVPVPEWRPDPGTTITRDIIHYTLIAGVGRKP